MYFVDILYGSFISIRFRFKFFSWIYIYFYFLDIYIFLFGKFIFFLMRYFRRGGENCIKCVEYLGKIVFFRIRFFTCFENREVICKGFAFLRFQYYIWSSYVGLELRVDGGVLSLGVLVVKKSFCYDGGYVKMSIRLDFQLEGFVNNFFVLIIKRKLQFCKVYRGCSGSGRLVSITFIN